MNSCRNSTDEIQSSINFLQEIEHLKSIYRKARVKADANRRENSAEHSWYAAIAAQIVKEFIDVDVDINKVIQILLIHDIIEIYAGDMFAFEDKQVKESHKINEMQAIENLCLKHNLQQVNIFKSLWHEFEACTTNEAKFAISVDRMMPFIQNMNNNGGSWAEFGITKTQILHHNQMLRDISSGLWQYLNDQLILAVSKGWVVDA